MRKILGYLSFISKNMKQLKLLNYVPQNFNFYNTPSQYLNMESNIQVVLRFRPLLSFEEQQCWLVNQKTGNIASMISERLASKVQTKLNKKVEENNLNQINYQFASIVNQKSKTEQIYNNFCFNIVSQCLGGINGTIFAYGQTCSGKTYSINGTGSQPGILPHALRHILHETSKNKQDLEHQISVSYIEIYNETITDLLQPNLTNLKIEEDPKWDIQVKATRTKIKTLNEALQLLQKGESNRTYRKKLNHQHSSRSHVIFRIYIESYNDTLIKSKSIHRYSVLNIVDLAGSERCSKTQSIKQTGNINKSLFMLSNVITKLVERQSNKTVHIPYRDSKLTRLLENSLGGNSSTLVLCCLSPSLSSFQQTISTLRFADMVKKVKNVKKQNREGEEVSDLQIQIKVLKERLSQLQDQYNLLNKEYKDLKVKYESVIAKQKKMQGNKDNMKQKIVKQVIVIVDDFDDNCIYLDSRFNEYEQILDQILREYHEKKTKLFIQTINQMNKWQKQHIFNAKQIRICSVRKQNFNQKEYLNIQTLMIRNKLYQLQNNQRSNSRQIEIVKNYYSDLLNNFQSTKSLQYDCYLWGCNKDGRLGNLDQYPTTFSKINIKIQDLALGMHHTLFISNGEVYGCGKNNYNQAAPSTKVRNDSEYISIPRVIPGLNKIISIAAGWNHSLALDFRGNAFSWGYGQEGQLGHGTMQNLNIPKMIQTSQNIKQVFAGHSHSAYLSENGDFFTFGCNVDYRLMHEKQDGSLPTLVFKNVVTASLGVTHTCLITQTNKIFAGGDASFGQLGILNEIMTKTYPKSKLFEEDKSSHYCSITQINLNNTKKPTKVSCGEYFTLILSKDGNVYSMGKGSHYRLGTQNLNNQFQPVHLPSLFNIVDVEAGNRHSLALNKDGIIYGWGFNMHKQISPGDTTDCKIPTILGQYKNKKVVKIKAGGFHSGLLY